MDSRLESALVASESSEREHVVDWGTGLFHASGSRLAEATFSDDLLVLCVQGICHSTITKASIKWSSRGIHDDIEAYFEFRNLVGKDFQQSYTNEEEEEDDEVEDDEVEDDEVEDDEVEDDEVEDAEVEDDKEEDAYGQLLLQ